MEETEEIFTCIQTYDRNKVNNNNNNHNNNYEFLSPRRKYLKNK